jgi:glycosyltransferase involved in cell wall biosynthesis
MNAAIIHNHPIHYQHLLFAELARQGLEFEVLYTASRSACRIETPAAASGPYAARIGFEGGYEDAPAAGAARFVWSSLSVLAPRVVLISGYCDAAAWTAWLWARLNRVPILLWSESNYFDQPRVWWKERLKRWFVTRCEAASVYGESNRDYLVWLGMPPHRIETGRICLDTSLFSRALSRARPRHKILLYVGRFSPEKNLPALIRAFAQIKQNPAEPELVLALAGYGPQERELRQLVAAEGLTETVQFLGPAKQRELPRIYRNADALVLPSLRETWGIVAAEAMACGLPVLVSRQCGCARDLVFPNTGWTFSPGDRASLVSALRRIAGSPREILDAMGDCAAAVAARYSPEECARPILARIQTLLTAPQPARRSCCPQAGA